MTKEIDTLKFNRVRKNGEELKDFDTLKNRLKEKGAKYYDEPYLRFKGTKYEQETFFIKDPNENVLEIKTLTANSE